MPLSASCKYIFIGTSFLMFGTACVSQSVNSPAVECDTAGLEVIASGSYIDPQEGEFCFYASSLEDAALTYRLNRDGSTEDLLLIPWSTISLRLEFVGDDPLNSYFTLYFQNSILDSTEAFSSPPVPLTTNLIMDRLLAPGSYPVIGLGLNEFGYDARVEFSSDRFAGYSYNPFDGPQDAGIVNIVSSTLSTDEDGTAVIDLALNFEVLIRQYYDRNSWRELRNGEANVRIPLNDLIP